MFEDVVSAARQRRSVVVFRGRVYLSSPGLIRVITWADYSFKLYWHLLFHGRRYERLLVVSNPPLAPLLVPLAGRPYALLLYDLYPQVLSQLQPRNPLLSLLLTLVIHLWHCANRWIFARSERIFTLSEAMAAELRSGFASEILWRSKVMVVPPWADNSQLRPIPAEDNPFRQRHGLDDRLLVTYSGNLGLTHPLESLLQAAALLKESVQILLIGTGPKRRALEQLARHLELSSQALRFLDPLPVDQLPFSSAAADLAVVALDGPAASASLPSKTFTSLASGTPILALAPLNSALAALVLQHCCGVVVAPGSSAASELVAVIEGLAGDRERRSQLAAAALAASRHYTPANAERLVEEWLGGGRPYL